MKDVELKLISELMKNSRRSDRELARAIGVSQPTVSRQLKRLEKEGFFQECTIIPNVRKLWYNLFALTFTTMKKNLTKQDEEGARQNALEQVGTAPENIVVIERGIGIGHDVVIGSFHEDYSSYTKLIDLLRQNQYLDASRLESFIIDLNDKIHYRPLTLSTLAEHLLNLTAKR